MFDKVILVTGGSGLIGKAIETVIESDPPQDEKWIFLSSSDCNLCDLEATQSTFNTYKPSHVIHLAAVGGGLFYNLSHNFDCFRKNLHINDNVLQTCYELGVKKVVSCLSTCNFPCNTSYPIDETMLHNGPPHSSNFGSSYSKRFIDIANQAYHNQYGCNFTSVIPCNVFGPNDNFNLESSHVIPALARKLHIAIESGEKELTVMGSGKPLRQFIYCYDLARLIIWVMRHYEEIEPIMLTVDEKAELTIKEVAEHLAKAFNFKGEIVFDTTKAEGQYKKTASDAKLRRYLPDFEFTPFDVAIQQTVDWFKANHKTARL